MSGKDERLKKGNSVIRLILDYSADAIKTCFLCLIFVLFVV